MNVTVFNKQSNKPVRYITCSTGQLENNYDSEKEYVEIGRVPIARLDTRDAVRLKIAELERQQLRPLRELQLNPSDEKAKGRLRTVEDAIARLRHMIG